MNAKVIEALWAWPELVVNPIHEELVRELLAYDCLCPISTLWELDKATGDLSIKHRPSAMSWSRKFEWPWCVQKGDVQWDHTVLDAGSGHSVFKYALASRCQMVHSLDLYSTNYAQIERGRPFRMNPNIRLVQADLRKLPYADGTFDSAYCVSVLEHAVDVAEAGVAELVRVVKPGRPALITMDVAIKNPTEEFPITPELAGKILATYGGTLPEVNAALCQVFGETHLLCLCFKLEKTR